MPGGAAGASAAAGGNGKRRRGEANAGDTPAGGAAQKKPRSVCPHNRQRSLCKECGGSGLCQHQRIRSRCKECRDEADKSMPAGLEELEEAGL